MVITVTIESMGVTSLLDLLLSGRCYLCVVTVTLKRYTVEPCNAMPSVTPHISLLLNNLLMASSALCRIAHPPWSFLKQRSKVISSTDEV